MEAMKTALLILASAAMLVASAPNIAQMTQTVPAEMRDPVQIFMEPSIVVKGEGVAPTDRPLTTAQKYLLAKRAAKVVALRELAEVLQAVRVSGETTVKDLATQEDQIRVTVDGLVQGAEVIYEGYDDRAELAVVFVRIRNEGAQGAIARLTASIVNQNAGKRPTEPRYVDATASKASAAVPTTESAPAPAPRNVIEEQAQPEAFDALVIDASGTAFFPASRNRILAHDGRVLFAPDVIAPEILARRPLADYTNELGKAKAILKSHGSKNPLILKAFRVLNVTDVQVSEADTKVIATSNAHTQFLEGAQVVFVL